MYFGAEVAFWIFAILGVIAAIGVVAAKNLFRAALMLVLCFFTVAGIYGSLSADFMAIAQVLVYMGAISVLIIFAVMLTKDVRSGNPFNRTWPWAFVICAALMGLLIFVFQDTSWDTVDAAQVEAANTVAKGDPTTGAIANSIFDKDSGYLLPLEIGAALILAAVIGAIALVREK
ncbi:MAG: NADH-quinone oxidoreductase subunit J [Dehalococcoidia bacterium]